MAHYLVAQLEHGRYGAASILSSQGIAELHQPAVQMFPGRDFYYGMGWVDRLPNDIPVWWHDGDTDDFHAEMMIAPDSGWGVVILTNGTHFIIGEGLNELPVRILSQLVGKAPRDITSINRAVLGIFVAFILVPVLQLLALIWRLIPRGSPGGPHGWLRVARRLVLPPVVNGLITLGVLVVLPQLFGGAAPLAEIMYAMPDFGLGVVISVLATIGWLVYALLAVRSLRQTRRLSAVAPALAPERA